MAYRDTIATGILTNAVKIGQKLGCKLVVETNEHTIKTKMEVPNNDKRAWDLRMFRNGNLFLDGYANPYKPVVHEPQDPKAPDTLDVEVSDEEDEEHELEYELVPSYRYSEHQDATLISQLVNPSEQWRLLVYGIITLGGLIFFNIIIVLWATGSFG